MGFFDNFRSLKKQKHMTLFNSIGEFSYVESDGTRNYKGNINSSIGQNIELLLPITGSEISAYQIEYFKKIENNWSFIKQQLKKLNSQTDFENYKVVSILIPGKENEFYDMDAEIVL